MMVSDEEKRWIVVGIAMNKVAAPVFRDYIKQGMNTHYANDTFYHGLTAPCALKTLTYHHVNADPNLKRLKFQNINNNMQNHGNHKNLYKYNVNSSVDLAKLFLPDYLAEFSAFDESLDMSAILRLFGFNIPAPIFLSPNPLTSIQTSADDVRENVRNKWGHCNVTDWTEVLFNDCFSKLETLVRSLGLTAGIEKTTLDQLSDWQTKGCQLCMGHAVDKSLLSLLQVEVSGMIRDFTLQSSHLFQVQGTVSALQEQLSSEIARSSECDARLDAVEKELQEEVETRIQEMDSILERLFLTEKTLSEIPRRVQGVERGLSAINVKVEELQSGLAKTDDKVGQLQDGLGQLESEVKSWRRKDVNEDVYPVGSFDATSCRRTLADHYKRTATVPTSVWSKKSLVDIHQIYTRLSWVKEEQTPAGSSQSDLCHYTDVFTANEKGVVPKRILVQGQTGIGKSTFVKKLAVDWAELDNQKIEGERRRLEDKENSSKENKESSQCEFLSGGEYEDISSKSDENASVNQEDVLRKFEILLVINLREVSKYQKLQDIINHSQIFPVEETSLREGLLSYITKNQEKVVLVFDGYDEYPFGNNSDLYEIFRGNKLRHCCVLVTTRISKADELREFKDVHAEITGFSEEDREVFMTRMLGGKEAEELKLHLSREGLTDLARVPLLLLFFCTLWKKGRLKTFPETKTKLYLAIVQYVLDYSQSKNNPARFCKVEDYKEILSEIGKVALECLLMGEHVFEYDQLSAAILGEASLIVGLLQVSEYSENLRPAGMVSFLHKSIQEFLAALYITYRCVPGGSLGEIEEQAHTFEGCLALENVFQFVCGLSEDGAVKVSQHFASIRISDPTLDVSKTVPYAGRDEDVLRIPLDFTHRQELFSYIIINSFQDVHSKAEFVRHCFHCTGGYVLASRPLYDRVPKVTDLTKLTHSGVFIFFRFIFSELYEWLRFLDCLHLPLRMTMSSEVCSVGDFLRRFYTAHGWGGPAHFSSILSFRDGQIHFYITALELGHDDHVQLFTETATIPIPRHATSLLSDQLCLKFLRSLSLLNRLSSQTIKSLGAMIRACENLKIIQVIEIDDSICYLLDQIPKPSTCPLKIGQKGAIPYILTSEGTETLVSSLSRFNNIVSLYLVLFDCCAAAVDNLAAGIAAHKSFKELSLCGIHLTPTAAESLGKALPKMLSLRSLCLRGVRGQQGSSLQAKDMDLLFGRIKKPIPMEEFSFQCFSVKGCLAPLTKSLRFFQNLRSLSLHELNLDESDLAGLQENSRLIPNLDYLDLSGNPLAPFLTSTGILPLVTIMISQGFKNLNLCRTGISEESIREAFQQMPPPLYVEYKEKRVDVIKSSSLQENFCFLSISFS